MPSSSSSSSITRPQYVQDMINQIYNEVTGISPASWVNRQYAGLNPDEQAAIDNMANSGAMGRFVDSLMGMGSAGKGYVEEAWQGLQDMYTQGPITSDDIIAEAQNFYDPDKVNSAITATNNNIYSQTGNTLANQAQSNYNQGAYTSGAANQQQATLSNALSSMSSADQAITNQAYNSALTAATGVLTGQRKAQTSALSDLANIGGKMISGAMQGANMANQANENMLKAGYLEQQNEQNQDNMNYFNQKGNQNLPWLYVDQMLKAAGVFNSAEGQTTNTTSNTSVSGGGLF